MQKIIFFGTPAFAQRVLKIVGAVCEVLAVVTQPDRPFGRQKTLKMSAIKELAITYHCPIFQPEKLDDALLQTLLEFKADLFLVVAFGQIFPPQYLQSALCLNIHASILPHLRGASPMQEMILEERQRFGVTIMKMEEGLDCGEILGISFLPTNENLTLSDLDEKLSILGAKLALKVLKYLPNLKPLAQIHCDATFCKKIKKEAGLVHFSQKIYAKYLALSQWPTLYLDNGLKLRKLVLTDTKSEAGYGKIIGLSSNGVLVCALEGVFEILEVQPPSKSTMGALDYVRGRRLEIGDDFC
ncbi:methionyl-tRNA formyltransferase [Helicobacter enhydrae]|uniref:Methionyl-tRNA formyltransferase n=1 Tax=Helicobacter enhydrae TaxID=222136 RepID=A0A1B1U7M4_9HELI|nr:methionyl-tRNA formyltransferase [Helicobacter enhydrae]ANV98783.1 methionyl-tRNA formyltransferase [Helicobacter enhydrae]